MIGLTGLGAGLPTQPNSFPFILVIVLVLTLSAASCRLAMDRFSQDLRKRAVRPNTR